MKKFFCFLFVILSWVSVVSAQNDPTVDKLHIKFLGTGAADWKGTAVRGELRRLTSVLIDGKILMDYTASNADMLQGCQVEDIVYTHSHGDHYNPAAALEAGCKRVYVSCSWADRAAKDFSEAVKKSYGNYTMPEIVPLKVGGCFEIYGVRFTVLPGNHATSDLNEQALIYLLEKGGARVLYATDTGGIPAVAARLCGIDSHKPGKAITGLIMEATMGMDYDEDFRLFTHSSVGTVLRTVNMLLKSGRYCPKEGAPVYITHLARTLHGTQAELDSSLPFPLAAAYDGLEVVY